MVFYDSSEPWVVYNQSMGKGFIIKYTPFGALSTELEISNLRSFTWPEKDSELWSCDFRLTFLIPILSVSDCCLIYYYHIFHQKQTKIICKVSYYNSSFTKKRLDPLGSIITMLLKRQEEKNMEFCNII